MRPLILNACVSEFQVPLLILVTCSPISRHVGPGTYILGHILVQLQTRLENYSTSHNATL